MNVGQRAGRRGRRRRWAGARVRRNSFRHGSGQAMGRRKSSPKFISARVGAGDGQAQEFAEIHFGTGRRRRWAGARVRRNSFRHGAGQAMGDRNEFRSTGRAPGSAQAMGSRKSSPKFISARVWAGDGQAQEFAEIHFGTGLDRRWAGARVRRNSFRHGAGQAMGRRKSSPKFISAWVWAGDGQAQEFAEIHFGIGSGQAMGRPQEFGQIHFGTGRRRRWEGARVRRNSFRHGSGQAMGRRKSSPKFISARVWAGDGQAQEFAEIHFGTGLRRRWAGARVRRHSFRHGSGQAMGRRKSSPTFISARVWTGDGQAQEFADIHFGMGLGRRWETEMNFGQRAGRRGRRRRWATEMNFAQLAGRRGLDRRWATEMNFAQLAGRRGLGRRWATEMNFGQRAGRRGLGRRWATARVRRNSFRHGSGQAMGDRNEFRSTGRAPGSGQTMGNRKSSPKFISAWVWTGDGRPK
jgi:hypothetical protein